MSTTSNSSNGRSSYQRFSCTSPNFGEICVRPDFIDKTMLLDVLMRDNHKVTVITTPPRFGKSTNMDMVKKFLEIEVDGRGKAVDRASNYETFSRQQLKIFHNVLFNQHFARYPVVYATLRDVRGRSFKEMLTDFRNLLYTSYDEHAYLIKSEKLSLDEKSQFRSYSGTKSHLNLTEYDITCGLLFLSQCLNKHFNKKAVILIDEFDIPFMSAFFNKRIELTEIQEFLSQFFMRTLKANTYMDRALLTGVSYLATVSLSTIMNVRKCMFLNNHPFNSYFGFVETDIDALFTTFNLRIEDDMQKKFQLYYNGYISRNNDRIYTLSSVLKFMMKKEFKSYLEHENSWLGMPAALHMPLIRYCIEKLLLGQTVRIEIYENIDMKNVLEIRKILLNEVGDKSYKADLYLNHLLQQGCLSYMTGGIKNEKKPAIVLPNDEIRIEFRKELDSYYLPVPSGFMIACALHIDNITPSVGRSYFQDFIAKLDAVIGRLCQQPEENCERTFHAYLFNVMCKTHFYLIEELDFPTFRHKPDLVFVRNGLGIIMDIRYKHSNVKVLKNLIDKRVYRAFDDKRMMGPINDRILLAVNVLEDLNITLAVTINSLDMAHAIRFPL